MSFCGCLTTMGEQSDARFRWQEIELHEHAKLHHFGTTVNNFPFTWRRRSIFRDALRAVGLCGGKTWRGRCRGGVAKIKFDKQKLLLLGSHLVNGNFVRKYQFHFLQLLFAISKTKRKSEKMKIKQNVAANMKPLFGISCGTSTYTIDVYTYVHVCVCYIRVNLSYSPKWRRQIRVLERHTKKK